MKADAECASAAAEVGEGEFGVVVEDDAVFERGVQHRAAAKRDAVEQCNHIRECAHLHFQAEAHFEHAGASADAGEFHFVFVVQFDEDLRGEDAFLCVEIVGDVLKREHLFVEHDALAGVDTAECAGQQRAPAHEDGALRSVFHQHECVKAEGDESLVGVKSFQPDIGLRIAAKGEDFERQLTRLRHGFVRFFSALELVDDFDGLCRDAEAIHERVKGRHLLLPFADACNDVVELHAEHDFLLGAEHAREAVGHGVDVLLLAQRVAELAAQIGVNAIGKSVAKKAEHIVHFLLDDFAFAF